MRELGGGAQGQARPARQLLLSIHAQGQIGAVTALIVGWRGVITGHLAVADPDEATGNNRDHTVK